MKECRALPPLGELCRSLPDDCGLAEAFNADYANGDYESIAAMLSTCIGCLYLEVYRKQLEPFINDQDH